MASLNNLRRLQDLMGHPQGRGLNALGQLGGLGGSLFGQQAAGAVQRMHASQQQMDELHRHMVDAQRYALSALEIKQVPPEKLRMRNDESITFAPDIDKMPIREYLQRRVDQWLAPVTI